jgi:hypothetical protein
MGTGNSDRYRRADWPFGAIAGGAFGSWFTWQKERQSIAAAFAGEVQGLIDVIGWRETREGILAGRRCPIDEHPFPVFDAKVGKIGLLPAQLAGDVAGFYSFAKGIVQDIPVIYKGEFPGVVSETEFRQNFVKTLDNVNEKGVALVAELQKEAKRTWMDCLQPSV